MSGKCTKYMLNGHRLLTWNFCLNAVIEMLTLHRLWSWTDYFIGPKELTDQKCHQFYMFRQGGLFDE